MNITPFKIKVTPAENKIIQTVLAEYDVTWINGDKCPTHTDFDAITMNSDKKLTGWRKGLTSSFADYHCEELTFDQFMAKYANTNTIKKYSDEDMLKFAQFYSDNINNYDLDEALFEYLKL